MRILALLLSILSSAAASSVQDTVAPQEQATIVVVRSSWSKEVVGWEKDPFRKPMQTYEDMQRQERRRVDPGTRRVDADEKIISRQKDAPRLAYRYKVLVKNTGLSR